MTTPPIRPHPVPPRLAAPDGRAPALAYVPHAVGPVRSLVSAAAIVVGLAILGGVLHAVPGGLAVGVVVGLLYAARPYLTSAALGADWLRVHGVRADGWVDLGALTSLRVTWTRFGPSGSLVLTDTAGRRVRCPLPVLGDPGVNTHLARALRRYRRREDFSPEAYDWLTKLAPPVRR